MSRANSLANDPNLAGLTGLNRQPLTPEQQMQALKRVQAQAEQRVKLGMQLFKAAEARLSGQTDVLQQIKTLQRQLKEQVNQDVAQTLHQYDQWIGQIDESFTTAIRKLEEKIDAVQANVTQSEAKMRQMLERAEALLDQSRHLTEHISLKAVTMQPGRPAGQAGVAGAAASVTQPIMPPIGYTAPPKPAKNADTDLHFSAPPADAPPVAPPDVPSDAPAALPPQIPSSSASAPNTEPAVEHDERIYSKLLQRLIEENKSAEADGVDGENADASGATEASDDKPDDRADAA